MLRTTGLLTAAALAMAAVAGCDQQDPEGAAPQQEGAAPQQLEAPATDDPGTAPTADTTN